MSLDKTKTNIIIGKEIQKYLLSNGVETPMMLNENKIYNNKEKIEVLFKEIMQLLNLNLLDDSLQETPKRIAKMYTNEVFWGLDYDNFPKITMVENKMKYDEMVIIRDISVKSFCEHHFVPFIGSCNIAYIPNKTVIGLSKFNRIVEFFSRRPQIQERLTEQIYYALKFILGTSNIAINIKAEHLCVKMRGVEDDNSFTITNKLGGSFMKQDVRQEFFNCLNISK